jgi:Zn-dependent membrane protease YugP
MNDNVMPHPKRGLMIEANRERELADSPEADALQEARTSIVPLVQLASQTAPWLFIAGTLLQYPTIAWVGIILFGSSSLFALITLPVEFNASARARELLVSHDIIRGDEQIAGVRHVLGAAAWTYVAAAVSAIGTWLFCRPSAFSGALR